MSLALDLDPPAAAADAPAPSKRKKKNAHLWVRHPDDWYVEPQWCDTGLFRKVRFDGAIVDPCCGLGRILNAAHAAGYQTMGLDIVDRGASRHHRFMLGDFFAGAEPLRNIVSNPPFKHADAFLQRALERAQNKVAVLLPSNWANAEKRAAHLETLPLAQVLQLSPRPSMPPGTVIASGAPVGSGVTDFAWYVFEPGHTGVPRYGWIRRNDPAGGGLSTSSPPMPGCNTSFLAVSAGAD